VPPQRERLLPRILELLVGLFFLCWSTGWWWRRRRTSVLFALSSPTTAAGKREEAPPPQMATAALEYSNTRPNLSSKRF
jgi:hypothetical protein